MHALRFAFASSPANFVQSAMEWPAPHAAHPVDLSAGLVAVAAGAAAVAATLTPPFDPFAAFVCWFEPANVLFN